MPSLAILLVLAALGHGGAPACSAGAAVQLATPWVSLAEAPGPRENPRGANAADSLAVVYAGGQSWEAFLAGVQSRRALWHENWDAWQVDDTLLERARATGGPWRILAVAEASCSDSVNTLPALAHLVAGLEHAELRVVNSEAGRPWMEAHRSPDGRPATPTFLLLDESFRLRGCWVEQPRALAERWLPALAAGTARQEAPAKMAWYADDEGRSTLEEFVAVMEAAVQGELRCPGGAAPG